jgi:hypothetical protein
MPVQLNHAIVRVRDKREPATFLEMVTSDGSRGLTRSAAGPM